MTDHFSAAGIEELGPIAAAFAAKYPGPAIFTIEGEMGAGKTTFIRAVCAALGASGASSPTFSLVNEYQGRDGVMIYHFDLYRIRSLEEALDIGFEEYLDRNAYVLIEWPDKVLPILPKYYKVAISDAGDHREIVF